MEWKIRKVWIDGINKERIFIEDENNTRVVMLDFVNEKDKENAKLITCAPEMLEMLKMVLLNRANRADVKALIKKATE